MLGNWSFGDYFKQGAIEMAWELLTKVWKLDPTRLHVTVHEGDKDAGIPRDEEAADIWHKVAGVPRDHIHYGITKDNFWEMGETGLRAGPCTEIFYDNTPDKSGGKTVLSGEDPRVMEIWNNVFIGTTATPIDHWRSCPRAASTPAWASSTSPRTLQGKATTTRRISGRRSSRRSPPCGRGPREEVQGGRDRRGPSLLRPGPQVRGDPLEAAPEHFVPVRRIRFVHRQDDRQLRLPIPVGLVAFSLRAVPVAVAIR